MELTTDHYRNDKLEGVKICRIATVPFSFVSQIRDLLNYLREIGVDVTCISSDGNELSEIEWGDGLKHVVVDIPRSLKPFKDIRALAHLFLIFMRQRYVIVHSTTPKAGLLTTLAAFFARVPIRLHTFTGQPWVTLRGPLRWFARSSDKVIGFMSTMCYADSMSQRQFLISEGIIPAHKIRVIGLGSLAGVDLQRFDPDRWTLSEKTRIRQEHAIGNTSTVIIYVGRIATDKGIAELISAFQGMLTKGYDVDLLLVGPLDSDCGGNDSFDINNFINEPRIHFIGYTDCPEKYLAISNIFCLPSYREGFGTVVIEAAAMGIPTVGTTIYGLIDAVVDGETGILVPPRNDRALLEALKHLLDHPDELETMGKAARQRCFQHFDANKINEKVAEEYLNVLKMKKMFH